MLVVLWICLPAKYCNQLQRRLTVYEKHSYFPSPGARFLHSCPPHQGEDGNSINQPNAQSHESERERDSFSSSSTHPKGGLPFTESTWERSDPPPTFRKGKLLLESRRVSRTLGWDSPIGKSNEWNQHSQSLWHFNQQAGENRKGKSRLACTFYQASHVTNCWISFLRFFFHHETGHDHKPEGKHSSWKGSHSTEKRHMMWK